MLEAVYAIQNSMGRKMRCAACGLGTLVIAKSVHVGHWQHAGTHQIASKGAATVHWQHDGEVRADQQERGHRV